MSVNAFLCGVIYTFKRLKNNNSTTLSTTASRHHHHHHYYHSFEAGKHGGSIGEEHTFGGDIRSDFTAV